MISLLFWVCLGTALAGLLIKYLLDHYQSEFEITWKEFGIAIAVIYVLVAPSTAAIGWKMARQNLVSYEQYLNGWETAWLKEDVTCKRDGLCYWSYDCDPYIEMESYSCNCDKDGRCQTCYRPVTKYHSCPYVKVETHYRIETTFKTFTFAENRFPDNPRQNRWRASDDLPQRVIDEAGVGAPKPWLEAKKRLDEGRPGPVVIRNTYDNYVLASDRTILKQYSGDIVKYKSQGLLPGVVYSVHDQYYADKVQFVGFSAGPGGYQAWQKALSYCNSVLGTELQGDLHLVIVQNAAISANRHGYALALKAYWTDKGSFGENAFPKNGIAVIVGTEDGQTIAWSKAFTGMPMGNEDMLRALETKLAGTSLQPESLIGSMYAYSTPTGRSIARSNGAIEQILWGFHSSTKFKRISMKSKDKGDNGNGYLYLWNEIQPTGKQKFWIGLISFFVSCIAWAVCAFVGARARSRFTSPSHFTASGRS